MLAKLDCARELLRESPDHAFTIQELAARVQSLETENRRLAQLENKAAEATLQHKSEMSVLHQELDGLKQIVQQMAAARGNQQNAGLQNVGKPSVSSETIAAR